MRFLAPSILSIGVFATGALHAGDPTVLGSAGEVYTVRSGAYRDLFMSPMPGAAGNPVLALEIVRETSVERAMVPGTEGPEVEETPLIALDPVSKMPYVVWQQDRRFHIAGFGAAGWQEAVQLAGDPTRPKRNPQLAASVVDYEKLDTDCKRLPARRTIFHLVWYEDAGGGARSLYTAVAVEGDEVVPSTQAFELPGLAGDAAPLSDPPRSPAALRERPLVRRGSDSGTVGLAFVDGQRAELVTLELRPIRADLLCFADKGRGVIIETGFSNPGLSHREIADKARTAITEAGRAIMHPAMADLLSNTLLDELASHETGTLEAAIQAAWTALLTTGIELQQEPSASKAHILELAERAEDGSSRAMDMRWVSRRPLPPLPDTDLRLFLSRNAKSAMIAWTTPVAVRYREANATSWEPARSISVGPTMPRDQAFHLVEQRLDE